MTNKFTIDYHCILKTLACVYFSPFFVFMQKIAKKADYHFNINFDLMISLYRF